MPIPCFTSTCTVDLSTDITGALVANANIAHFQEYPGGNKLNVGINSDTGPGLTQYNTQTNHNVEISHDFVVPNPFACAAWCRFQAEYFILGEGRTTSMANPCSADPTEKAAALCQNLYYCRSYGVLSVPALGAAVLGPTDGAGNFIQRHDQSGVWTPAQTPNPTFYNDNYLGWNQELSFLMAASTAYTVTAKIHIDEKWHFDLSSATGGSLTGSQGVIIRGGTSMIFPAAF